jgi:hypothetical protein
MPKAAMTVNPLPSLEFSALTAAAVAACTTLLAEQADVGAGLEDVGAPARLLAARPRLGRGTTAAATRPYSTGKAPAVAAPKPLAETPPARLIFCQAPVVMVPKPQSPALLPGTVRAAAVALAAPVAVEV